LLTGLAAAVTVTGLVTTTSALTTTDTTTSIPTRTTTVPSTTIAPRPTATTTSTTSTTVEHHSADTTVHNAGTQNPDAYYGNPKVGVQVATSTPGLYPIFNGEPNLSGFAIDANTATGQAPPPGTSEPQPVCSPSTSLTSNPAPNVYCEADPNGTNNFPMASSPANYELAVSATPDGWYHSPDQTVPIASSISSCLDAPVGQNDCALVGGQTPSTGDVTWFDYIGIFRSLVVKVTNSSGAALSGVKVTLTCTSPAGAPPFA
jgi:hypothetical protein